MSGILATIALRKNHAMPYFVQLKWYYIDFVVVVFCSTYCHINDIKFARNIITQSRQ
jgi:hypothetical protein